MKTIYLSLFLIILLSACQKCNLKGDVILNENFETQGEWLLFSEYDEQDRIYTRIEDGNLKLKSDESFQTCQRATFNLEDMASEINGFQICFHINELNLTNGNELHFYVSLEQFEMHATLHKQKVKDNKVVFKVDADGVKSSHKGALVGGLREEMIKQDLYQKNFVQIVLCPDEDIEEGELYLEVEALEISIL